MKISVDGFIRSSLKMRIKKAKIALAKKAKNIAAMEKELSKYSKRK